MDAKRRRIYGLSALASALAIALPVDAPAAAEVDCLDDPRNAAIARFVGEWEEVADGGGDRGLAEVRSILGGCAFEDVRREGGVEVGRGLIYLDPASGRWMERWVAREGASALLEIEPAGDGLLFSGTMHTGPGDGTPLRIELEHGQGPGLTQRLYWSLDGGATWEAAQITSYRLRGAEEPRAARETSPAAPASPAPRPASPVSTPPPPEPVAPASAAPESGVAGPETPALVEEAGPGGVVVRSERSRAQPPADTVTLESPMTLELELGPVDALPAGTAWQTAETAVYLVDEIRMPQVSASRRERRGKVELEVTVNLRTTAMQRRVDLEVELLADGESLGRERAENIALGKLIGSHDPRLGRPTTLRFALEAESFAALFADGKRPSARVTVTVK